MPIIGREWFSLPRIAVSDKNYVIFSALSVGYDGTFVKRTLHVIQQKPGKSPSTGPIYFQNKDRKVFVELPPIISTEMPRVGSMNEFTIISFNISKCMPYHTAVKIPSLWGATRIFAHLIAQTSPNSHKLTSLATDLNLS